MEKPFTLIVQDTEEKIIKILNESKIPAFVLKNILQNLFNQLSEIEKNEVEVYLRNKEKDTKEEKKSNEL